MKVDIFLPTLQDVYAFVAVATDIPDDISVTLCQGRYVVNAKSIMGILSLNLIERIHLEVEDEPNEKYEDKFKQWIVRE